LVADWRGFTVPFSVADVFPTEDAEPVTTTGARAGCFACAPGALVSANSASNATNTAASRRFTTQPCHTQTQLPWIQQLVDALNAAVDVHCEPTWDTARGEFTWGFNLNEPHPRGQFNGTMAAAQVATEGTWWRLANVGPGNRFDEPTVIGVDFPTVALREARWDPASSTLTVVPVGIGDASGRTTFRVTTIGEPNQWTADGQLAAEVRVRVVGAAIEVDTPVRNEAVLLRGPAAH
jgi:hypothetical protein